MKILLVAEKPSIAKDVSRILSSNKLSVRNSKNKYIKIYDFMFEFTNIGFCEVSMTSVVGHLTELEFHSNYRWGKCDPEKLFEAEIITNISKPDVYKNISDEAKKADKLFIWTDYDREGEYIGFEILKAANESNKNITIENTWRSKFSHLERLHILNAAKNPTEINMNSVSAVECRMEIDFRVGTSFTRLLTNNLKKSNIIQKNEVVSYGTCQFPTLGFVVERYKRVKNFVPELFWYINVELIHNKKITTFNWSRVSFFDRLFVIIIYEKCLSDNKAIIYDIEKKIVKNFRPYPLTTIELQKECSTLFKISAKKTLDAAEKLYNKGFISYPRTETNIYPSNMNFKSLLLKQSQDHNWGNYSKFLIDNTNLPRNGKNDDKAHPPIHPINYVNVNSLSTMEEKKVYEYVVRRFLASISEDAVGEKTTVILKWVDEFFSSSGLIVLEKNYLQIFSYHDWKSTDHFVDFKKHDVFDIYKGEMKEGKTTAPKHMTETELISLMDKNSIGTDATIADHIEKIIERGYIVKKKKSNIEYIIPSVLGMNLINGFNSLNLNDFSLSNPSLRKFLEKCLNEIVEGKKEKDFILNEIKNLYKHAFDLTAQHIKLIINSFKVKYNF